MNRIFLSIVSSLLLVFINAEDDHIVSTTLGQIQGSLLTSNLGKTIYSFRGIPYAEAPIGDLRFEPPVPIISYNGKFDAREEGPACYHIFPAFELSEDCLRLNVYTINITESSTDSKKAVIVFLHPGSFHSYSGQSIHAGPEYILNHDIVLVTLNYRLGSFGFLSTGDKEAPGNNGMKDQVAALKWVHQNIAAFSGDPDNVTIMGASAGALSSILHLVSPMAKGLFHKVIAMSGAIGGNLRLEHNQQNLAEKQAMLVGCPINSTTEMMFCLKRVPAKKIHQSFFKFFEFNYDPSLIWKPVIEPDFGQDRYLTDDPVKLLTNGNFSHIPIMMGVTEFEYAFSADNVILDEQKIKQMNEDWDTIAPIAFIYERNTSRSTAISKKLKDNYLKAEKLQDNNLSLMSLTSLYSDAIVNFPARRCADFLIDSSADVYFYKFSYKGEYSHFYIRNTDHEAMGAVHCDDLIYLFHMGLEFPIFNTTHPDHITVKRMTKMWTDFAIFGNPIPEKSPLLNNASWQSYKYNKTYMDIGSELQMKSFMFDEQYNVWNDFFPVAPR